MPSPPSTLQRTLASSFAEALTRSGLSPDDLAARAGLAPGRMPAVLAGEVPVPWTALEVLAHVLGSPDEAPRLAHLQLLRSRLEAPDLGLPGSFCLCVGDAGGHLVRRAAGQVFCSEHGLRLTGCCPHCDERLEGLLETSVFCPACGEVLVARRRARRTPSEVTTVRRTLAVFAVPSRASEPGTHGRDPADEIRRHNAALGVRHPDALSPRARVHYDAARALHEAGGGRPFTRPQLREAWTRFADDGRPAPSGSILPRTFCPGDGRSATTTPWFLRARGRGAYVFVGLDGLGDGHVAAQAGVAALAAPASTRVASPHDAAERAVVTRLPLGRARSAGDAPPSGDRTHGTTRKDR
ncbi:MAG: hypothetical protein H6825_05090 [Planctomycetes bacterium]|nr:hypothetical protein [Planctomycetota bacterium]